MRVRVLVSPGARRVRFSIDEGRIPIRAEIAVKEVAEGNRANERVRELLALHFRVDKTKIRFVSGMRGTSKLFDVIR